MDYQTLKITLPFVIKVIPSRGFALSDHQKDEIEAIWQHEQMARTISLFNGQILHFVDLHEDHLIGEFVEYKYYLAQLRQPMFKEELKIRPLCVSGITLAGNKLLIGKRSKNVTQYPEFYETVPSGGIDSTSQVGQQVNLQRQFEHELREETEISATEIKKIEIFALFHDTKNDLYEVCAEIQVNYTCLQDSLVSNGEHLEFLWLTKQELKTFLKTHAEECVPFTLHLLKQQKFI